MSIMNKYAILIYIFMPLTPVVNLELLRKICPVPRSSAIDRDVKKLAAALLYARGEGQSKIVQILNLKQSTVSRLLQETEGKLWKESIELMHEKISALSEDIRHRANELADAT